MTDLIFSPEYPPSDLIQRIEHLAFRAWPATEVEEYDGWQARFAHGVTHRANSVWPNGSGEVESLDAKLAWAEAFYAARGRPAIFQMCPASQPPNLDSVLDARGYTASRETEVQLASTAEVLAGVGESRFSVTMGEMCDDRWLAAYRELEGIGAADAERRAQIMRRISPSTAYAIAWSGITACAVGSAVCDGGWVGVFNMTTAPAFRRQGAARAVLSALARWAADDAVGVYLQVMRNNVPALALYGKLGFKTLYRYHYRSKTVVQ